MQVLLEIVGAAVVIALLWLGVKAAVKKLSAPKADPTTEARGQDDVH